MSEKSGHNWFGLSYLCFDCVDEIKANDTES